MQETTTWVYNSPIGPIYIRNTTTGFQLIYDNECYGNYSSAVAAADDVFTFSTGCYEWDSLSESVIPPTDICEWEKYQPLILPDFFQQNFQ